MMIIELVTPTCVGLTMSVLFHAAAVTAAWVYFGPGWEMLVIVSVIVLKWIAGLCLLWKVVGRLALRSTHVKQFRAIVEGMVGTAITDLNPSGTALIDAECVSVSSEYGSVPLDSRIIVT
jgi:membrane-bound ClpP family serine protease